MGGHVMLPMDLAMRLLKMPVVDTKVPGLKVAHGFDEPVRELHNYNPSAGYGKKWQAGPELIGATNFQTDEMEEMTPNEYFDRLAEVGINTFTGQKKFPVPHEKTLLGQSQKIQDQFADSEHRTLESMRHQNMKFPPGEGPRMVDRIVEGIKQNKVMGAPEIDMTGDTPTGYQEGGHRMDALRLMGYGDTPIPVAITRQTDIQTGEPMDLAMRLLKMPLLPESIKRVSDNRTEAQFQDPKTNQIYPMVAEKDPKFRTMNVGIYPNQPGQNLGVPSGLDAMDMGSDEDINENVKGMLNLGLSNAELTETNEDGPYYESDMTWTDPEKRRRGYASALYNLVNQLDERKVRPSDNQSDEGKQLWRKRMLPKGEPMDIAMRLLKEEVHPGPYSRYAHDYTMPTNLHPDWDKWVDEIMDDGTQDFDSWTQNDMNYIGGSQSREEFFKRANEIVDYQMNDAVMETHEHENNFRDVPFNEETDFTRSEPMDLAFRLLKGDILVVSETVAKKLCPAGKAAAKRKFKVYPSAYANGWAVQYCKGKFRGKKKK